MAVLILGGAFAARALAAPGSTTTTALGAVCRPALPARPAAIGPTQLPLAIDERRRANKSGRGDPPAARAGSLVGKGREVVESTSRFAPGRQYGRRRAG